MPRGASDIAGAGNGEPAASGSDGYSGGGPDPAEPSPFRSRPPPATAPTGCLGRLVPSEPHPDGTRPPPPPGTTDPVAGPPPRDRTRRGAVRAPRWWAARDAPTS